jgi:hypothetical protein
MSIHPLGPRPGRRLAQRRAAAAGGGRPGGAASPAAARGDRRPVVAGQGAATRMAEPWEKVGETHGNLGKTRGNPRIWRNPVKNEENSWKLWGNLGNFVWKIGETYGENGGKHGDVMGWLLIIDFGDVGWVYYRQKMGAVPPGVWWANVGRFSFDIPHRLITLW